MVLFDSRLARGRDKAASLARALGPVIGLRRSCCDMREVRLQVFLNEARTEMHIELNQR